MDFSTQISLSVCRFAFDFQVHMPKMNRTREKKQEHADMVVLSDLNKYATHNCSKMLSSTEMFVRRFCFFSLYAGLLNVTSHMCFSLRNSMVNALNHGWYGKN